MSATSKTPEAVSVLEDLLKAFGRQHVWVTSAAAAAMVQQAIGRLSTAAQQAAHSSDVEACPIALEALELVAMQPATRGVYLLDQQDMDFVKKAVKALKGQA